MPSRNPYRRCRDPAVNNDARVNIRNRTSFVCEMPEIELFDLLGTEHQAQVTHDTVSRYRSRDDCCFSMMLLTKTETYREKTR